MSVVIPCFNQARYLRASIDSVIAQSFNDWELLVIDDGSTDDTYSIARDYELRDSRVKAIHQDNAGLAGARKAGVKQTNAITEYFLFLDADDVLEPTYLDKLVSYLDHRPEASIAHCLVSYIDEFGKPATPEVPRLQPRRVPTRFWLRTLADDEIETPFASIFCASAILPSTALMRRSYYERTKGWDESIRETGEDVELYLDLALISSIHFVAERLVRYRLHSAQSTVANPERFTRQVRALYQRWSVYSHRPQSEQDIIIAAFRFKRRRYDVMTGLRNAQSEFRQKAYLRAARAVIGPSRRALGSIVRGT